MSTQVQIPAGYRVTGSRYFGTNRKNSDFDYFAPDSPEIRLALELDGFKILPLVRDMTGATVIYRKGKCDVQLVTDPLLHERIQSVMKRCNLAGVLMYKELARALWLFAYTLARSEVKQ